MESEIPFNSFLIEDTLPSGKSIRAQIIDGKCQLLDDSKSSEETSFKKKYTYPLDDTQEDITKVSNELQRIIETVNNIKITEFSLEWGMNPDQNPYLIRIIDAKFELKLIETKYIKQTLLFLIDRMNYTHSKRKCYSNQKNCTESLFNTDKISVEQLALKDYISSLPDNAQEALSNQIFSLMNKHCPNLLTGSCSVCPLCFKRISSEIDSRPHGFKKPQSLKTTFFKTQTTERCYQKSSRPLTSTTSRSIPSSPVLSTRSSTTSLPMTTQSSNGLRATQSISLGTYKKAHRIYCARRSKPKK